MFCPLCEKEYRDGFSECSDCHLALVATLAEAESENAQLWKGVSQSALDEILSRLDEAGITRYYKEEVSVAPRLQFFGIAVRAISKFEVRVLRDQLPKAQDAIQGLANDSDEIRQWNGVLAWLVRRTWGLSLVLGFATFFGLIFVSVKNPEWQLGRYTQGPIFRLGEYLGSLFSSDYAARSLFGAVADVLFLSVFWFTAIWWIKELRAPKRDATTEDNLPLGD